MNQYRLVKGDFISLRTVTEDDAEHIYNWRKSVSGQYLNHPENYSLEGQKKWIVTRPSSEINFIIYSNFEDFSKVGMISIVDIDPYHKKAEVGRLLLDSRYLSVSTPYGLEALKITYDIVLNQWKFNKIYGSISGLNSKMIELQKFLGMYEEGILKKHLFVKDDYFDLHLFGIFRNELNTRFLPRINLLLKAFNNHPSS